MLGRRQLDKILSEKIPVYEMKKEGNSDNIFVDPNGISFVGTAYAIQSGVIGILNGTPLKVYKSTLKMIDKSEILAGSETTMMFPIMLEEQRMLVWVPSEFTHML